MVGKVVIDPAVSVPTVLVPAVHGLQKTDALGSLVVLLAELGPGLCILLPVAAFTVPLAAV